MPDSSSAPCPVCFHRNEPEARFCSRCGASLDDGGRTISAPPPPTAKLDTPGSVGGRYRLGKLLGRGAFGAVYRATDEREGREVAVKMLTQLAHAEAGEREQVLKWFRREAQALSWLRHPGIVELLDVGDDGGVPFLVMEYVDGTTLAARLAAGRLPPLESVRILSELLAAVGHAHSAGVVHRDLKPANVLIADDGAVKVTDFGLAKVDPSIAGSVTAGIVGTPHYMSPEQAASRPVDARSDLFSIGVIAYEMLTGTRAFDGPASSAIYKILYESPPAASRVEPTLPQELDRFLCRAMEKSPELRFTTADEMARALRSAATFEMPTTQEMAALTEGDAPMPATAEMDLRQVRLPVARPRPPRDPERTLLLASVLVVLGLSAAAALMYRNRPQPVPSVVPAAATAYPVPRGRLVVRGAPAGAKVAVDGAIVGTLPTEGPLPSPGEHVISVFAAGRRTVRRLLTASPDGEGTAVRLELPEGEGTPPEALSLLGTVVVGREPGALLEDAHGGTHWVRPGSIVGEGRVAFVVEDGLQVDVPLSPPDEGSRRLKLPLCAPRPRADSLAVVSDPPGAIVMLGDHVVGYTPCRVSLPKEKSVNIVLKAKARSTAIGSQDTDRLLTMGEISVLMP